MNVVGRRHGGWSNDKRFVTARQLVETVGDDAVALGSSLAVVIAAVICGLVLPKPQGFFAPAVALGTVGLAWKNRIARQPVSFLIERARWERCRDDLADIPGLRVDVGRLAKAVDKDGTTYDVLLTCSRRDATAVRRALGMEPAARF